VPFRTEFDHTLLFESIVAGVVFVSVLGLLTFALVRYRARHAGAASQSTEHPQAEGAYATVLVVIAAVIVLLTRGAAAADNRDPSSAPLDVRVTGFQWCWEFDYVETGVTVSADCQNGHYPTLVLPAGVPVRIQTTSRDVIHSFWLPAFRFKMDAFPDHMNSFVLTVPHPGVWLGHCAEFCGEEHAFMTFHLRAVPPATFQTWLSARGAAYALAA
jgi:cytochrome c oxidase subunit 2